MNIRPIMRSAEPPAHPGPATRDRGRIEFPIACQTAGSKEDPMKKLFHALLVWALVLVAPVSLLAQPKIRARR